MQINNILGEPVRAYTTATGCRIALKILMLYIIHHRYSKHIFFFTENVPNNDYNDV